MVLGPALFGLHLQRHAVDGDDAQHLAAMAPGGLVFVASENGVSHAPGEAVAGEDVGAALGVLCELLRSLQRDALLLGRR